jgi:hypothetical protein
MQVQTIDELKRQRDRTLALGEAQLGNSETKYVNTKGEVSLVV